MQKGQKFTGCIAPSNAVKATFLNDFMEVL